MHLHLVARKWLLCCTRLCVHFVYTKQVTRMVSPCVWTAEECVVSHHTVSNEKHMKLPSNATSSVFFSIYGRRTREWNVWGWLWSYADWIPWGLLISVCHGDCGPVICNKERHEFDKSGDNSSLPSLTLTIWLRGLEPNTRQGNIR